MTYLAFNCVCVCVCDLIHLMGITRRNNIGLYWLSEVFAVSHHLTKLPQQLSSDLWRHGCVCMDKDRTKIEMTR